MSATELQSLLIHRISEIGDVEFLKALKTIVEAKADSSILPLTIQQRDEIIESKKEIAKGLYVDHTEVENEINGWLNER
jgi:predicted transcriptional regulator